MMFCSDSFGVQCDGVSDDGDRKSDVTDENFG